MTHLDELVTEPQLSYQSSTLGNLSSKPVYFTSPYLGD
jgi:hypothetical protein